MVTPGLLFLRVTFSESMSRCDASFEGFRAGAPVLMVVGAQQSPNRKSFIYETVVPPNTSFHFTFGGNFSDREHRSTYGAAPKPYDLFFSTSGDRPLPTLTEALKADPHIDQILAEPGEFARLTPPCRGARGGLVCQLRNADLRAVYAESAASDPQGGAGPDQGADPAGTPRTPVKRDDPR